MFGFWGVRRWLSTAHNSWWTNYGQIRRSTDRNDIHRLTALSLATTVLMTCRLIDYRNKWGTTPTHLSAEPLVVAGSGPS